MTKNVANGARRAHAVNHLDNILVRIRKAGEILSLSEDLVDTLSSFKLKWESDLEVKMDGGGRKRFKACRVWYRSPHTDQPHKGGIRFHPDVNVEMMQAHAMEMGLKCWLMGIPWGGAKGGVAVDPALFSTSELKRLTEALVDEMDERAILGPFRDVPAPDVGTNARIMNWIRQRYAQRRRSREDARFAGVVTGKPVGYGLDGIEGRAEATGFGVMHTLERVRARRPVVGPQPRLAVMGFGNVGSNFVQAAKLRGYPVVAVSDVNGAVYAANGLDIEKLFEHYRDAKTVVGFKGGEAIGNDELLVLQDIDVLVPAALEHVLTKANASKVGAKLVIEGANSPTTSEADSIFEDRGILVVPDICANAGGVTVSFFEWARNVNIRDERVPRGNAKEVIQSMECIMASAIDEMLANAEKYGTSLRNAALVTAIGRVAPLFAEKHLS
ncbi:MAG TPA: Glu/Leu/Phe/Val dehydrogenase [Candidatus Paceibacterota bacterium]